MIIVEPKASDHMRRLADLAARFDDDAEPVKPAAELLTVDQAAAYLGITDDQVAAFVRDGSLDYINVGRGTKRPRIRFTKPDLDGFIDRRRQKEVVCLSTKRKTRRSITSTSNSVVVGFVDRRNAQRAAKPKPSKP
jgi:excisionase family DNA binding protein